MLSTELWLHILEFLDCKSLLRYMETSREMRDLICGTASLRYKIALRKAHLINGPICGNGDIASSSAAMLELLAEHQAAWDTLSWNQSLNIPKAEGSLWELFGGVMAHSNRSSGFVFHQLPSKLRSIPYETWSLGDGCFDFNVRDFGMDPSEDLLVLIECTTSDIQCKLHLANIRTGKPYSGAAKVILQPPPSAASLRPSSFTIQVSGDYVGVLSHRVNDSQELTIWNWKTGVVKLSTLGTQINAFSFLSSNLVLIGNIIGAGDDDGSLDIVDFQNAGAFDEARQYSDLNVVVQLEYPSYEPPAYLHSLEIRNDPGPMWKEKGPVPFSVDPTESLFIVRMWLIVQGSVGCLLHVIPSPVLLSYAKREGVIPWAEWGPKETMIGLPPMPQPPVWVCFVHGWKYVMADHMSHESTGFTGYCLDFSPTAALDDKSEDNDGPRPWRRTEDVPFHRLFQDVIGDYIPHKWRKFHLPDCHWHCEVMCNEDNIILVDSECGELRILSF